MGLLSKSNKIFWFLTNNPKLSFKSKSFIQGVKEVIIPSIALMEILYILEKNNLASRFIEILSELKIRRYLVYPLFRLSTDLKRLRDSAILPKDYLVIPLTYRRDLFVLVCIRKW